MALITTEPEARRLARALISDINMYCPDLVEEGLQNDTLFEVLALEIELADRHYRSRVVPAFHHLLGRAINDVLVLPRAETTSPLF